MSSYIVEVEERGGTDEVLIRLPDAVVKQLGLKAGDKLNWDMFGPMERLF